MKIVQLSQSEELNHTKLVERGEPLFLNKSEAMTRTQFSVLVRIKLQRKLRNIV